MGILNIHAALSAAFRLRENVIYCKVALQSGQNEYQRMNKIPFRSTFQSLPGGICSLTFLNGKWIGRFSHTVNDIQKPQNETQGERMPLGDWRT